VSQKTDELLQSILDSFDKIGYIRPEDLPNLDLYMDQVTTFMDHNLKESTRYPDEDKILTKTMINNYAKNRILPSPDKKKYSKEHILILIFIYYFKGVLSINDIKKLLDPLTNKYFDGKEALSLEDIYKEVFTMEKEHVDELKETVKKLYEDSKKQFKDSAKDLDEESQEFLQKFAFICLLSYDVYVKTLLIEKMIDSMSE